MWQEELRLFGPCLLVRISFMQFFYTHRCAAIFRIFWVGYLGLWEKLRRAPILCMLLHFHYQIFWSLLIGFMRYPLHLLPPTPVCIYLQKSLKTSSWIRPWFSTNVHFSLRENYKWLSWTKYLFYLTESTM